MSNVIKSVMIFKNKNVAVFDDKNEQIGKLQIKNIEEYLLEEFKKKGYDVSGVTEFLIQ